MVFKFGGASLKSATAIRNMAGIVKGHSASPLVVVVSAMGKTTNALEQLVLLHQQGKPYRHAMDELMNYHHTICRDLFTDAGPALHQLHALQQALMADLERSGPEDEVYDRVVSYGELFSSVIVCDFLKYSGITCMWKDARDFIQTDAHHREGRVNWPATEANIKTLLPMLNASVVLTQGFIGRTPEGNTTTLGREGSDYTAAIFASCLPARLVTIWKDVPGVMNADPKRLPAATVFAELPYKEAAEMTYYGASVIHPKTIKPLANKGIPLFVKSFDQPELPGTKIHDCRVEGLPPLIVFKDNQCLVSCRVTDYTFINEHQLSIVFHALSELDIKINVMQNSAISFSFCIDYRESRLTALIEKLQHHFEVYYNTNLTLITVKNYDEESFTTYRKREGVLIEQSSRSTLQVLVKS